MDELLKLFHIHEYILNNSKWNMKNNIDNSYARHTNTHTNVYNIYNL